MKNTYVITGATGNTGKVLSEMLLAEGHTVRIIGRDLQRLQPLIDKGAEALVGTLDDTDFLTEAYREADAVFAMIPPNFQSDDYRAFQNQIAKSHVTSIKNSHVKNVVALSSIGGHLSEGAGIVLGLHDFEEQLRTLEDVNVLILRPSYFMENLYWQVDTIKKLGITGSPIAGDVSQPVVATKDIAEFAAKYLSNLEFKGFTVEYILGERDLSYNEITTIFGKTIGIENLQYVQFSNEDFANAMVEMGVTKNVAELMLGLTDGINNGVVLNHYKRTDANTTATSIEHFVVFFAQAYKNSK